MKNYAKLIKNCENHWINHEKQIKISSKDAAGDIKGGQARPRTKIEPSMANQILLPPPGWSLLNREAWCFRAAMHFQPSWQHDNQVSSETNTARISFLECSDHVSVSLATYLVYGKLCMYWWSYASKRLYIVCFLVKQCLCFTNFHFLPCRLLCTDRVWHLIRLSTLQRSIFLWSDMDILDVCLRYLKHLQRALRSTQCRQSKCRVTWLVRALTWIRRIDVCTCEIISDATLSSLWTVSYTYVVFVILVWNISWYHCPDLRLCETLYKLRPTQTGAFQNQGLHWNDCKRHGLASKDLVVDALQHESASRTPCWSFKWQEWNDTYSHCLRSADRGHTPRGSCLCRLHLECSDSLTTRLRVAIRLQRT